MNKFEKNFFKKYIPEGQEMKWTIHEHRLKIINTIFLWLSLWVLIPSFVYYNSIRIQLYISFYFLEIILILSFIKIIYEIFNWYNDVWIITDDWVVDLDWTLFSTDLTTINYENIEWVEVEQHWIIDKILNKWTLIIHKIWDDNFELNNAINPYSALDKIEVMSKQKSKLENVDKFDLVMETLWWVMDDYLERKWLKSVLSKDNEKNIENIINNEWTIDLR